VERGEARHLDAGGATRLLWALTELGVAGEEPLVGVMVAQIVRCAGQLGKADLVTCLCSMATVPRAVRPADVEVSSLSLKQKFFF
jgi:hypothetical protein